MRTTLDIIQILWTWINGSSLKTALAAGGGIYKNLRPLNSNKEDVVINCLPVPNAQLQQAVANVNIHVADKLVNHPSGQSYVPDFVRLTALTNIAVGVLTEFYGDDYHFELQQITGPIKDDEANSHYMNIRIDFFSTNISN